MKKLVFAALVSMSISVQAFDFKETFKGFIDTVNVPVDYFLHMKETPVIKELFNEKDGKIGEYARYPKLALTLIAMYMAYKNEKVQNVAKKVTSPVTKFMNAKCCKKAA